jgi:hypothetical protein
MVCSFDVRRGVRAARPAQSQDENERGGEGVIVRGASYN